MSLLTSNSLHANAWDNCSVTVTGYQIAARHESSIAKAKGEIDRQFWRDFRGNRMSLVPPAGNATCDCSAVLIKWTTYALRNAPQPQLAVATGSDEFAVWADACAQNLLDVTA